MEPVRLNKYLSEKGLASRREADRLAEEGRILVNGQKAEPGMKVTDADRILFLGEEVTKKHPEKVIIAVNKPAGVVCTTKTFPGEVNVLTLVDYPERLYPVGRLDKDSTGLLFLTNDGDFAAGVTRASGNHEKEYEVTVNREMSDRFLERLSKGIYLKELDKKTAACRVTRLGEKKFGIVLHQGLNRQIRRMCEACGYEVTSLQRVRIMNVKLGELKEGSWRLISGEEKNALLAHLRGK